MSSAAAGSLTASAAMQKYGCVLRAMIRPLFGRPWVQSLQFIGFPAGVQHPSTAVLLEAGRVPPVPAPPDTLCVDGLERRITSWIERDPPPVPGQPFIAVAEQSYDVGAHGAPLLVRAALTRT